MTHPQVIAPNAFVHEVLHRTTRAEQALLAELQLAGHLDPDQAIQEAHQAGQLYITGICPRTGYRHFQPGPLLRRFPHELLPYAYLQQAGESVLTSALQDELRSQPLRCCSAGLDDIDTDQYYTLWELRQLLRRAPTHMRALVKALRTAPAPYQARYQQGLDYVYFDQELLPYWPATTQRMMLGVLTCTYDRFTTAAAVRAALTQDPYLAGHLLLLFHQAVGRQLTAVLLLPTSQRRHKELLARVATYCQQTYQGRGFLCTPERPGAKIRLGSDPEVYAPELLS